MIIVVHYGAGNIRSVTKAIENVGARVAVSADPRELTKADKVVLPGVGAFGKAVEALRSRRLIGPLKEAIHQGKPFLGICLGFQLLFSISEESPGVKGLSILNGKVKRFPKDSNVPHLGWNRVDQSGSSPLWKNIPDGTYFYFAHSYFVKAGDVDTITGTTVYGFRFVSALTNERVFGVQFHPEKSQKWGLKLLNNFIAL